MASQSVPGGLHHRGGVASTTSASAPARPATGSRLLADAQAEVRRQRSQKYGLVGLAALLFLVALGGWIAFGVEAARACDGGSFPPTCPPSDVMELGDCRALPRSTPAAYLAQLIPTMGAGDGGDELPQVDCQYDELYTTQRSLLAMNRTYVEEVLLGDSVPSTLIALVPADEQNTTVVCAVDWEQHSGLNAVNRHTHRAFVIRVLVVVFDEPPPADAADPLLAWYTATRFVTRQAVLAESRELGGGPSKLGAIYVDAPIPLAPLVSAQLNATNCELETGIDVPVCGGTIDANRVLATVAFDQAGAITDPAVLATLYALQPHYYTLTHKIIPSHDGLFSAIDQFVLEDHSGRTYAEAVSGTSELEIVGDFQNQFNTTDFVVGLALSVLENGGDFITRNRVVLDQSQFCASAPPPPVTTQADAGGRYYLLPWELTLELAQRNDTLVPGVAFFEEVA